MGPQPVLVAVGHRGDDEFVGAGHALQRSQSVGHLIGITDELGVDPVLHEGQLLLGQRSHGVGGSGYGTAPPPARTECTQWP